MGDSQCGLILTRSPRNVCTSLSLLFIFFLEQPIKFLQELKNIQVQEGNGVTLCCEVSKAACQVQWKKGDSVLSHGEKYQLRQSHFKLELLIRKTLPEDSGPYSCTCDEIKTTATVIINGEWRRVTETFQILHRTTYKVSIHSNPGELQAEAEEPGGGGGGERDPALRAVQGRGGRGVEERRTTSEGGRQI